MKHMGPSAAWARVRARVEATARVRGKARFSPSAFSEQHIPVQGIKLEHACSPHTNTIGLPILPVVFVLLESRERPQAVYERLQES